MRLITATIVTTTLAMTPLVAADNEPVQRLGAAAAVFSEIMAAPDKGIPQDLLEKAHCIVIVPDLKTAAFVFGGKYGKGYLSCRNTSGAGWSAPGTVRIEGGSVGFQIGGSSTDLIMEPRCSREINRGPTRREYTWHCNTQLSRIAQLVRTMAGIYRGAPERGLEPPVH